jgi:hypothetical protein
MKRAALYFNHEDCQPILCEYAAGPHGACQACRHRHGQLCLLTRAALPKAGGCCHFNVEPTQGPQIITRSLVIMLGIGMNETPQEVLTAFEATFEISPEGQIILDPRRLNAPEIYGIGSDH